MQEQDMKQQVRFIAEQAIPAETDLWPAIRLRAQELSDAQRKHNARKRIVQRAFAIGAVALTLVSGLLLAVPAARTAFGGVLQQFGLVFLDMGKSNVSVQFGVATPAAIETTQPVKMLSLEEARAQAPFPIHTPAWLPNGLVFDGVLLDTVVVDSVNPVKDIASHSQVAQASLYYFPAGQSENKAQQSLALYISRLDKSGEFISGYAASREYARPVQVNGRAALYVKGGYELNEKTKGFQWNENRRMGALAWELDGVNYVLAYYGLNLNQEDLVHIAESVQ